MENIRVCIICQENMPTEDNHDRSVVCMSKKGIASVVAASRERKDDIWKKLQSVTSISVHINCRKEYTKPQRIKAAIEALEKGAATCSQNRTPSKEKLRSSLEFDFKTKCLYCAESIDEVFKTAEKKKAIDKRLMWYAVRSLSLRETTLSMARSRRDEWGRKVEKRLIAATDLIAEEAVYHHKCCKAFFRMPAIKQTKPGRPQTEEVTDVMNVIFQTLESSDDCQFSLDELLEHFEGLIPDKRTVLRRLKEKYGDEIILITSTSKKDNTIICFRDTGAKILSQSWYGAKKDNEQEERLRIVKTAAKIIREDIRNKVYNTDVYPPCNNFFRSVETTIPESLKLLLTTIVVNKRRQKCETAERKCTAAAHVIVSAARPRSFLSPLLIGNSIYLHRKYGSKDLLMVQSKLGFAATYHETMLFESSALNGDKACTLEGRFCQYVFDNSDHNTNTLDGQHTYHGMGGIACVAPKQFVATSQDIERLKKIQPAKEMGIVNQIPLRTFESSSTFGLKEIAIKDLTEIRRISLENQKLLVPIVTWVCGKYLAVPHLSGWNGFMETLTQDLSFDQSTVIFLPFINMPPSHYDTVYSAIMYAAEKTVALKQETCIVTFDQPLYIKARDIVAQQNSDLTLCNTVVRLGGFHTLMSFLGTIGYIMAGSGIKELLSTIYAPVTVEHMLSGRAYARSLRGHSLIQLALSKIILDEMHLSSDDCNSIKELLADFHLNPPLLVGVEENNVTKALTDRLQQQMRQLENYGPTAKLWCMYFRMVLLVKKFIAAERMGNWELHLDCVQEMIPYFHSAGHFHYAKSCHLYFQDMCQLKKTMREVEFEAFINRFFTVRRSNKFWTGIWTDMTIEQTLIRLMKSSGGLTHGRGISSSVLNKWTQNMTVVNEICSGFEEFCGYYMLTGEQHVECRTSRIQRDNNDLTKLNQWLAEHPPSVRRSEIISLATGAIGGESINCYQAEEIGLLAMKSTVGSNFKNVKLRRKDRVLPLATACNSVNVNSKVVPIDPLLLFQRICLTKQSEEELRNYFQFELAPFPLSLFTEGGIRKSAKSVLFNIFEPTLQQVDCLSSVNVIDGGFLLHRVSWGLNETYFSICNRYISFIKKYYGLRCTIVFDGYKDLSSSVKNAEQKRRSLKHGCVDIQFTELMKVTVSQEIFLSNSHNKTLLIAMLTGKLIEAGFMVKQADNDADVLIANTAIEMAHLGSPVNVVGEDVDLLVLLTALAPSHVKINFLKPAKGKIERKVFSLPQLVSRDSIRKNILFLHAFSGCDTTSSFFGKGKLQILKILEKQPKLNDSIAVFYDQAATADSIASAGIKQILALYGAPTNETSLNQYRFNVFCKSATKSNIRLAALPPTEDAAGYHSYRVYLQVQLWLNNTIPADNYGWRKTTSGLQPIPMAQAPAC